MVNVSDYTRRFLGYDYVYLTSENDGRRCFCELSLLSSDKWVLSAEAPLSAEYWRLHVHFDKYELEYRVLLSRTERRGLYAASVSRSGSDKPKEEIDFEQKIIHLEKNEAFWNKRREPRIAVGEEGAAKFGLSSVKQDVYIAGEKYPCVINDASKSGLRFTTYAHDFLTEGSVLKAALLFVNPLERVEIEGVVRNVVVKKIDGGARGAAFVSLELKDSPASYTRRLASLA